LKIFLGSKEKKMMYSGFSWWSNCTFNSKTRVMEREVEKAKAARLAAEKAVADLKAELSGDGRAAACAQAKADAEARMKEIQNETDIVQGDIDAEKARLAELEALIKAERDGRKADKATRAQVEEQIKQVSDDKKSLEAELALIVDQIGFLSEYSTKKK